MPSLIVAVVALLTTNVFLILHDGVSLTMAAPSSSSAAATMLSTPLLSPAAASSSASLLLSPASSLLSSSSAYYRNGAPVGGLIISNPSFYSYTTTPNQSVMNKLQLKHQQHQHHHHHQQQQQQTQQMKLVDNHMSIKSSNNNNSNLMTMMRSGANGNHHANSIADDVSVNSAINVPTGGVAAPEITATTTTDTASKRYSLFTNQINWNDITTDNRTRLETSSDAPPVAQSNCPKSLAVYKVILHTYWTRGLFPKHYPDWRPSAQWTKTLGRTHDSSYALYHMGQQATMGVRQFAETGKSDILDSLSGEKQQRQRQQPQQQSLDNERVQNEQENGIGGSGNSIGGDGGDGDGSVVFDEFQLPAILNGGGRAEGKFFADSNHSLVSLMTRIVPSPDWFIGIDSFQLCVGGSWIDMVTLEMDPLDAGTDNGFTFTAPNWPTSPQGVIYRITSHYPAHPASSFFYPQSKRLPPIATFQFIKLKEYELSEVFNFDEDEHKYETIRTQTHLQFEHNHVDMNNELSASIERERQSEQQASQLHNSIVGMSERERIRSEMLAKLKPMYNNNGGNTSGSDSGSDSSNSNILNNALSDNIVPKNDKQALLENIASNYNRAIEQQQQRRRKSGRRSRDCRVSHWSEWTACSKPCGIGEMHRYRKVIKHGKRGGRPCPPLQESKWCGSEKGCHAPESYFNWSNT